MFEELAARLKGRVVIMGIGNTLKGDDAAGSVLASRIAEKLPYKIYDAGASPENFLGKLVRDDPDNIIIIDAADFGGKAGEIRFFDAGDLRTTNMFSTHNASISLSIDFLKNSLEKVDIAVVLIQPKSIKFEEKMTPEVSFAVDKLETWFLKSAM